MMLNPVKLTIYGRTDCHLCDEARHVIDRVAQGLPIEVREIDIESHDDLLREYLARIPVVAHAGQVWFEFEVSEARLRELVRSAASIGPRDHGN
jgi:glutaredoxin